VIQTPVKRVRWSNLSREERAGLNELKYNQELMIKKADKGSAIVVMNTSDYITETERQLSNSKAYKRLTEDPTEQYCKEILSIFDTY
jgi:hypothetical protein